MTEKSYAVVIYNVNIDIGPLGLHFLTSKGRTIHERLKGGSEQVEWAPPAQLAHRTQSRRHKSSGFFDGLGEWGDELGVVEDSISHDWVSPGSN